MRPLAEKKFQDVQETGETYSQTSQVEVDSEKWLSGSVYTCKATHDSKPFESSTSICSEYLVPVPSIHLEKPKLESVANNVTVTATCVVFTPYQSIVSWTVDHNEKKVSTNSIFIKDDNNRIKRIVNNLTHTKSEWKNMKSITCEANHKCFTHVKETIDLTDERTAHPTLALYHQLKHNPAGANGITLVCSLAGFYPNTITVTWEEDDKPFQRSPVVKTLQNLEEKDTTFSQTSQVEVDITKWLTGSSYTCKAKHNSKEFSNVTSICSAYPISSPSIHMDSVASHKAITATCVVFASYKSTVSWIVDGNKPKYSPTSEYFKGSNNIIQRFVNNLTIPRDEWKSMKSISCEVKHRCFPPVKKTINLTGETSVKLFLWPSLEEGGTRVQTFLCLASGFKPQVTWLLGQDQRPATANRIVIEDDGHITVASEIEVPHQEWTRGDAVTCEVDDLPLLKSIFKNISICTLTPPSSQTAELFLIGPSLQDRLNQRDLPCVCMLVGFDTRDFTITWKVNGEVPQRSAKTEAPTRNDNGTETMRSTFHVRRNNWDEHKQITCEAKHLCSGKPLERYLVKTKDPRQPKVQILTPSDSDLEKSSNATLVCLISDFFPSQVEVHWEMNGTKVAPSRYASTLPLRYWGSAGYIMHSRLLVPQSNWTEGEYSCVVRHESSKKPIRHTVSNVFASATLSPPQAFLLQFSRGLVCLVHSFSPAAIDVIWLLKGKDEQLESHTSSVSRGPDGKFTLWSHLAVSWEPGALYTCRVLHVTQNLSISKSQPEITAEIEYFDENTQDSSQADSTEEIWNTACAFLILFLITLLYSSFVTLIKVK
ncbi:hypothetical protein AAFF_G00215700 [Aldrovandia affinis]|uniref:Ig-like domain-containing protein n=1 Tax=Aldrovandia affinis TaxID=143900 RepID=A0AAD7W519_9TELE|nr:hypothetical protein AAFF_G00215700 [Aldrovandia affinis]